MSLLITTPEEIRLYLPTHVFRNLDTMAGFLRTSQDSFLRERIGQPLLSECERKYAELFPDGIIPILQSTPTKPSEEPSQIIPWLTLIQLCQRIIVFDAFERAASIRALSENDMGLNVPESENYDAAPDKRIEAYRSQLNRERHEAVNLLLLQLEDWHTQFSPSPTASPTPTASPSPTASNAAILGDTPSPTASTAAILGDAPTPPSSPIPLILSLWQQSPTYYLVDGLLIPTATAFQQFVDIYDSREKFIQIIPDIRYCQEVHIESEIGESLLSALIAHHRTATLTSAAWRAYIKLQRTLSLYVEARSRLFSRKDARDEAQGHMHLTLDYLRRHQRELLPILTIDDTRAAHAIIQQSPIYDPSFWPEIVQPETAAFPSHSACSPTASPSHPSCGCHPSQHSSMHITPLI